MMRAQHEISRHLRSAVSKCTSRGLHLSSSWAAEQLTGLLHTESSHEGNDVVNISAHDDQVYSRELNFILHGQALLTAGEYQRCGHLLKSNQKIWKSCSYLYKFIALYADYLAWQKLLIQCENENVKTENVVMEAKDERKLDASGSLKNGFLMELYQELAPMYFNKDMDGFLLFLFAVVVRDIRKTLGIPIDQIMMQLQYNDTEKKSGSRQIPDEKQLLTEAVGLFAWNWSCWLELAKLCVEENTPVPTWPEISDAIIASKAFQTGGGLGRRAVSESEKECVKVMYTFFLIHVYVEKHRGDMALQAISTAKKLFPESLSLYAQTGLAEYAQRNYLAAEEAFEHIRAVDPYRLANIDIYSNLLYVQEKTAELSVLAHTVVKINKFSPESCCVVGNYYSLKGQHERAIQYFQRALRVNPQYLSAWTLMGHEYMELKNTAAAVQSYRKAVEISASDYRAWYGLGQTYEMLHLYQYASYYYKKAACLRPMDSRMWCAVGNCYIHLQMKAEAIMTLERAVQCGDREGIATKELARLYRSSGSATLTAKYYFQYLQTNLFQVADLQGVAEGHVDESYSSQSVRKSAANLETMAAKVESHVRKTLQQIESEESSQAHLEQRDVAWDQDRAESALFLANYYRARQAFDLVETLCNRLMSYVGREGEEARAMLRELRHHSTSYSNLKPMQFATSEQIMQSPGILLMNADERQDRISVHETPARNLFSASAGRGPPLTSSLNSGDQGLLMSRIDIASDHSSILMQRSMAADLSIRSMQQPSLDMEQQPNRTLQRPLFDSPHQDRSGSSFAQERMSEEDFVLQDSLSAGVNQSDEDSLMRYALEQSMLEHQLSLDRSGQSGMSVDDSETSR